MACNDKSGVRRIVNALRSLPLSGRHNNKMDIHGLTSRKSSLVISLVLTCSAAWPSKYEMVLPLTLCRERASRLTPVIAAVPIHL